jgi:hypothetical protein
MGIGRNAFNVVTSWGISGLRKLRIPQLVITLTWFPSAHENVAHTYRSWWVSFRYRPCSMGIGRNAFNVVTSWGISGLRKLKIPQLVITLTWFPSAHENVARTYRSWWVSFHEQLLDILGCSWRGVQ